jgi:DNA (cytosine-5)-methyltransferase 1
MRHGSLFSGIGGFDLASEWMGWENVFHCEWMEFPRKVLDYYWPDADSHIDICKTDFTKYANKIDILTGGFPCQPFSMAGKRKGTDDERYLWGEMLRAIQEIKPKFVIAENVFGITNIDGGLVFEQVCLDLENEGYEVQPFIIPAVSKNAPHRRDRVWFIAQNTNCIGLDDRKIKTRRWRNREFESTSSKWKIDETHRNATDTNGNGFNERNGNDEINTSERGEYALGDIGESNVNGNATDTNGTNNKTQPQERILGQTNKSRKTGGFVDGNSRIQWTKFPTQSPICGGDDGLPTKLDGITFSKWRAESIKGYGNAIVPQVAFEVFKIIETL